MERHRNQYPVDFGKSLRTNHFKFDPSYLPLNHGTHGTIPTLVKKHQRTLQDAMEARPDMYIGYQVPDGLRRAREAVAQYLDTNPGNIVFVPNASTGLNIALQSLQYKAGDVIIYFSFAYHASVSTVQRICETTSAESHCIDYNFPSEDRHLMDALTVALISIAQQGKKAKLLLFDTVVSFPGVSLPWDSLVQACHDEGILSVVDGAHGIGHVDLRLLDKLDPDFFTTSCHKWLFTPRACGMLYVSSRNLQRISSFMSTVNGCNRPNFYNIESSAQPHNNHVNQGFVYDSTVDHIPYLCLPEAINFRQRICGGEERIRNYCFGLAADGGELVARFLHTSVMRNSNSSINQCCFTNVLLPLTFTTPNTSTCCRCQGKMLRHEVGQATASRIIDYCRTQHDTWIPVVFYNGSLWARLSAQIYLDLSDFQKAAEILLDACSMIMESEVAPN